MKGSKEVDWSRAPEGATHYNAECIYPWLKETPASYYCGRWDEYSLPLNSIVEDHFNNAVKRPQWDGSGVPPIGTVCEYLWVDGDEWRKCEIVAYYYANVVAVDVSDSSAVSLPHPLFRPIKTPEQIAAEERLLAIDEMVYLSHLAGSSIKDVMEAIYDAGYRKQ